MTVSLSELIDLSLESINVCMEQIIMLIASLVYLMVAVGQMIFFVFGIGSGLGCDSLLLSLYVK